MYKVTHPQFGEGIITKIYGSRMDIDFSGRTIHMVFPGAFSTGLKTSDKELIEKIKSALNSVTRQTHSNGHVKTDFLKIINNYEYSFIGPRCKSIDFESNEQLFEVIGYLANPRTLQGVWAEIPPHYHDAFQSTFPSESTMLINESTTPNGIPNKFGAQCRLNIANADNCPSILQTRLAKGLGKAIVNRINSTLFVLHLVKFFGFHFGNSPQDVAAIRKIAMDNGYLHEFNIGFNR